MTKACNLEIGFKKLAAIECTTDQNALASILRDVFAMPANRLADMGRRGRALVEEEYQWPKIAGQMAAVYKWLLGQGPKPECVRED
jgi:poly(glycerol-phosphate) alpha-glucosyltransferase